MTSQKRLQLMSEGRVVLTLSVNTELGKRSLQRFNVDAIYFSDPQFKVFRSTDGDWNVEHIASAKNETIVDGKSLKGAMPIRNGTVIAVGNSSKGIVKLPLMCNIEIYSGIEMVPRDTDIPPRSEIERPGTNHLNDLIHRLRLKLQAINWDRVREKLVSTLGTVIRFVGALLGAILSGVLRGAVSGGASGYTQVHRGGSSFGETILTIDGNRVISGNSAYGNVILTIDGTHIRQGNSMYGDVLATVEGDSVREGFSAFGNTFATVSGNTVFEGPSMFGNAIATVSGGGRMAGAAAAVYLLRM